MHAVIECSSMVTRLCKHEETIFRKLLLHDAKINNLLCLVSALLSCYQCDSSEDIRCSEELTNKTTLRPLPCNTLSEASYCVKMTGVFGGILHFAYNKSLEVREQRRI